MISISTRKSHHIYVNDKNLDVQITKTCEQRAKLPKQKHFQVILAICEKNQPLALKTHDKMPIHLIKVKSWFLLYETMQVCILAHFNHKISTQDM